MLPPPQQNDTFLLSHYIPNNPMLPLTQQLPQVNTQVTNKVKTDRQLGRYFKIIVCSTILFFCLSQLPIYKAVSQVYTLFTSNQNAILDSDGIPTLKGNLVQSVLFFILMIIIIYKV